MSAIIEALARAICSADGRIPDVLEPGDYAEQHVWELYIFHAEVALAAVIAAGFVPPAEPR